MQATAPVYLPKVPLAAAIGLVVIAVAGVAAARIGGLPVTPGVGHAAVIDSRVVSFEEMPNGTLHVRDAGTGDLIATAKAGQAGFLHGSMRGLMFNRKREGVAFAAPFRIDARSNGQVVLTDLSDGAEIELNAFGHGNAMEFRNLLHVRDGVTP